MPLAAAATVASAPSPDDVVRCAARCLVGARGRLRARDARGSGALGPVLSPATALGSTTFIWGDMGHATWQGRRSLQRPVRSNRSPTCQRLRP